MFNEKQIEALKAPLNKSHVKQRAQAGRQLSYIEGWHAIDEANRIFGFDGWERHTLELRQVCEPYQDQKGNWRIGYMARVRITIHAASGLVREGCGYGSGIDRDLGSAHESALKEAETDAMKRALMTFGNPFGLALYDKEQKNVAISPVEVDKTSDRTLANALVSTMGQATTPQELAGWFKDNSGTIEGLPEDLKDEVRSAYAGRLHELKRAA